MLASQELRLYQHDIANRYGQSHTLLDHWDEPGLPVYRDLVDNPVRYMREVVGLCLQSESRARKLLNIIEQTDRYMYDDMQVYGPRGDFREWWFSILVRVVVY